jgi:hypothetical protein
MEQMSDKDVHVQGANAGPIWRDARREPRLIC